MPSRRPKIPITAGDGWQLGHAEDPTLIAVTDIPVAAGDPRVAIVEVGLARNVGVAVDRAVSALGLAPSRRLSIGYGPDADHVDAAVAAAATAAFGRRLKKMRDEGVTEAHVFLAGPAPLALLLGASVNAGPAMTLYHTADGEYVHSVRLLAWTMPARSRSRRLPLVENGPATVATHPGAPVRLRPAVGEDRNRSVHPNPALAVAMLQAGVCRPVT